MASKFNTTNFILVIALVWFFSWIGVGAADSFPFRGVKVGEPLPAVAARNLGSRQDVKLTDLAGQPLLLVLFGADMPAKKKRAVKILKAVHNLTPFLTDRGVAVLALNAQGDPAEVIKEVALAAGFDGQMYIDIDKQVYGGLGVFVMPSLLLVKADGTIAAGLGYSRDLGKRLKGEIEIMLGEKTRGQVEEELHPKMVEKSAAEKGATRHFNLGLSMLDRGRPESALRAFAKAIALLPEHGKAYIYQGCLQLDEGKIAEAQASLARGLELEPGFVPGQICQAQVKAAGEDLDGAIEDLTLLMMRNSRNDNLHYVLAGLLARKDDLAGAMGEYQRAYDLLRSRIQGSRGKF